MAELSQVDFKLRLYTPPLLDEVDFNLQRSTDFIYIKIDGEFVQKDILVKLSGSFVSKPTRHI